MIVREKNKRWTGTQMLFVSLLLLIVLIGWGICAYAQNQRIGTLNASGVRMRSGPGTNYEILGSLNEGESGTIVEEGKDTSNMIWYRIRFMNKTGWVRSDFIDVRTISQDFKKELTAAGFPESYHASLLVLHDMYPNWKFQAQQTNLDWKDVIAAESKLGVNLVHTNSISSWKSIQNGAYNWQTGTWYGLDSSEWVAASTEIIEHYMDPRNFLDETYIFQFIKQSYDSSQDYRANLTEMVKGTFLAGSFQENGKDKTYVDSILEAAQQSGVSPYTIATMIIQEQGINGTGGSISGTEPGYEGYYNFFNVAAYAANGLTPVQKGLLYAKTENGSYGRPWNTRTKSIAGGAQYFAEGFISRGQDTIYLKKFNVQGKNPYEHQYMTNIQGAASEGKILSKAYGVDTRKTALEFKIPVYKNMPGTSCPKPTGNGSPNNMLQSLSIAGQSLTPTFDMYETSYSVIVPYTVSSVTVSAKAYDTKATITGVGTVSLKTGNNTVKVNVKAQSGSIRTYTITIIRSEAPVTKPEVAVTSTAYKLDNSGKRITGIKTFPITTAEFEKGLSVKNGSMKLFKEDGTKLTGNVGTGCRVKIYDTDGALKKTYDIVIYGDATGDGRVNAQDLLTIQKNNIKISVLSGAKAIAADVNRDGRVNAQDLLLVQKNNIKIKPIEQ